MSGAVQKLLAAASGGSAEKDSGVNMLLKAAAAGKSNATASSSILSTLLRPSTLSPPSATRATSAESHFASPDPMPKLSSESAKTSVDDSEIDDSAPCGVVHLTNLPELHVECVETPIRRLATVHTPGNLIAYDDVFSFVAVRGTPSTIVVSSGDSQAYIRGHLAPLNDMSVASFPKHTLVASVDENAQVVVSVVYMDAHNTVQAKPLRTLTLPLQSGSAPCLVKWHPTLPAILFAAREEYVYSIDLDAVGLPSEIFNTSLPITDFSILSAVATPRSSEVPWKQVIHADSKIASLDVQSRETNAVDAVEAQSWELGDVLVATGLAGSDGCVILWKGTASTPFRLHATLYLDHDIHQVFVLRRSVKSGSEMHLAFAILVISGADVTLISLPDDAVKDGSSSDTSDDDAESAPSRKRVIPKAHLGYRYSGSTLTVRGFVPESPTDAEENVFDAAGKALAQDAPLFGAVSAVQDGHTHRLVLGDARSCAIAVIDIAASTTRHWKFQAAARVSCAAAPFNIAMRRHVKSHELSFHCLSNTSVFRITGSSGGIWQTLTSSRDRVIVSSRPAAIPDEADAAAEQPDSQEQSENTDAPAPDTPELAPLVSVYSAADTETNQTSDSNERLELPPVAPHTSHHTVVLPDEVREHVVTSVSTNVEQAVTAKLAAMDANIRELLITEVTTALRTAFTETVVPAFERATTVMVSQIANRLQSDIQVYQAQVAQLTASMREATTAFERQASAYTQQLKKMDKPVKEKEKVAPSTPMPSSKVAAEDSAPAVAAAATTTTTTTKEKRNKADKTAAEKKTFAAVASKGSDDYEEKFNTALNNDDTTPLLALCSSIGDKDTTVIVTKLSPVVLLCAIQRLAVSISAESSDIHLVWLDAAATELEKRLFANADGVADVRGHVSDVADAAVNTVKPLLRSSDGVRSTLLQNIGKTMTRLRVAAK